MTVEERIERLLSTEQATLSFAQELAPLLKGGDLVILTGGLGAGKTFFSGGLCRALGLSSEERVTSPTYNLVQEYCTEPKVLHCDLYRLSHEDELDELGLEEAREAGALLVVEWGAPYIEGLGGDAIELEFELEPRRVLIKSARQVNFRQAQIYEAFATRNSQSAGVVGDGK